MELMDYDTISSQPGLFVPAAGLGNPFFEISYDGSEVSLVRECWEDFH